MQTFNLDMFGVFNIFPVINDIFNEYSTMFRYVYLNLFYNKLLDKL